MTESTLDYKPGRVRNDHAVYNDTGCLQKAFRQAGYDIGNLDYVLSEDIQAICDSFGLEHHKAKFKVWVDNKSPVIVFRRSVGIENSDHAIYFESWLDVDIAANNITRIIIFPVKNTPHPENSPPA